MFFVWSAADVGGNFNVLVGAARWWWRPRVRIVSSPPYPLSYGTPRLAAGVAWKRVSGGPASVQSALVSIGSVWFGQASVSDGSFWIGSPLLFLRVFVCILIYVFLRQR